MLLLPKDAADNTIARGSCPNLLWCCLCLGSCCCNCIVRLCSVASSRAAVAVPAVLRLGLVLGVP